MTSVGDRMEVREGSEPRSDHPDPSLCSGRSILFEDLWMAAIQDHRLFLHLLHGPDGTWMDAEEASRQETPPERGVTINGGTGAA